MSTKRVGHRWAAWLVIGLPLLWLALLFLLPFAIVAKISLSQSAIAQPPYTPVLDLSAGWQGFMAWWAETSFGNYTALATDRIYLAALWKSLQIAAVSTLILLLLGYPMAYGMARMPARTQRVLVLLVILPFWTSFLIRVYAWVNILQRDGLLNSVLLNARLIDEPIAWLATDAAVYIGIVYSYLPFMVLPLYASLERMDPSLHEAAADLGARPSKVFWAITIPLSKQGILAGTLLSFIPIMGEFVIPDLLGGSSQPMMGQVLWTEFFVNRDWPLASALAVVLLLTLVIPIAVYQNAGADKDARAG